MGFEAGTAQSKLGMLSGVKLSRSWGFCSEHIYACKYTLTINHQLR